MKNHGLFTIGSLAQELGVCVETVRYYHRIGLMPVPAPPAGSTVRQYTLEHFSQLQFIKKAQCLGFSLSEIRGLIALSEGTHCAEVCEMAKTKLHDLEEKMAEIRGMRDAITGLIAECSQIENKSCPMIDALHDVNTEKNCLLGSHIKRQ